MPDDNEKSVSSASTSPCHSPKSRLLAPHLFVVLYNFKPRHADELELKAGYKLTVIDSSDKDWWKGKCFGAVGVFPSTYVAKLAPREKPLQVIQSVNINSLHADGIIKLLRDQIVIQVGMDGYHCRDGSILIRTAEHRQGQSNPIFTRSLSNNISFTLSFQWYIYSPFMSVYVKLTNLIPPSLFFWKIQWKNSPCV